MPKAILLTKRKKKVVFVCVFMLDVKPKDSLQLLFFYNFACLFILSMISLNNLYF